VEVHYAAAQSTPKSDALQRNIGRIIPVRPRSASSVLSSRTHMLQWCQPAASQPPNTFTSAAVFFPV